MKRKRGGKRGGEPREERDVLSGLERLSLEAVGG